MKVFINPALTDVMRGLALRSNEVGGAIFGWVDDSTAVIRDFIPIANVSPIPSARYIPPKDYDLYLYHLGLDRRFRSCIGTWHTHPNGTAQPSDLDLYTTTRSACPYVMLIVSAFNGVTTLVRTRGETKQVTPTVFTQDDLRRVWVSSMRGAVQWWAGSPVRRVSVSGVWHIFAAIELLPDWEGSACGRHLVRRASPDVRLGEALTYDVPLCKHCLEAVRETESKAIRGADSHEGDCRPLVCRRPKGLGSGGS